MNKHYYKGVLLRTSKNHTYKYALIWKDDLHVFACSNNRQTLEARKNYLCKGWGKPWEGSHLWSNQFHDPTKLEIVELEIA